MVRASHKSISAPGGGDGFRMRWGKPRLSVERPCVPHLTPTLSAPKGGEGADGGGR